MVAPGESRHFASPNGSTQPPQRTGLTPPCRKPGLDIPSKVTSWELKTLAPPTMGNAGPVDAGGILLFLPHAASLPVANTGPKMRSNVLSPGILKAVSCVPVYAYTIGANTNLGWSG